MKIKRYYKLKDIFFNNLLNALILPVGLLVGLAFVVYYLQVSMLIDNQKNYSIGQFHQSMHHIVQEKAKEIEQSLGYIEISLASFQNSVEEYFNDGQNITPQDHFRFEKNGKGFWFKPHSSKGSGVVFMPQGPILAKKICAMPIISKK